MRTSIKLPLAIAAGLLVSLVVAAAPAMAEFGLQRFAFAASNQDGTPDVQAGSHPYALNTTFLLNLPTGRKDTYVPQGNLKDVRLEIPPGFVGDPNATPHCTYQEFVSVKCPNETVIGVSTTYLDEPASEIYPTEDSVYNLVPPTGVAAEFGFLIIGKVPVFLDTGVRTGTDYGLTVTAPDVSQAALPVANKVTIWGVPADPSHNLYRGTCLDQDGGEVYDSPEEPGFGLREGEDELEGPNGPAQAGVPVQPTPEAEQMGGCATQTPLVPLLTNPTSCGTPRTATLSVDDWEEPGVYHSKSIQMPEMSGCEKLDFSPTIGVIPDGTAGSTPTGLNIGLHVPQETTENPVGLAESDVRDTTVTLPEGVQLSPSASNGQQACSTSQIGFTGFRELDQTKEPGVQTPQFTPNAPSCPNASKVANVKIKTPLLSGELTGSVYLASPQNFAGPLENPFGTLVSLYLVAEEPVAGVLVKIAGKVIPNPQTGQLVSTFENTPALPFSDLKFEFFGSDRAPLATPSLCGAYTTNASFEPWSGVPPVNADSSFNIDSGPQVEGPSGVETLGCSNPLPFKPTLESGTTNVDAGAFSTLDTTLSKEDGQQNLTSIELHYPNGISGLLDGVKLCPEAQANAGTCGPESEIGETTISVGLGNDPFTVTGGKVYITEKYEGASFGLSIVNPAKAGPFVLQEGRPVVVRAKIEVNPITAGLTVVTDPPGSAHAIPTMIEGIPLQVKHVNATINRPGFTFNPTNCTPSQVTGTIKSAEGSSSSVSVPFQVTNCASLKFEPKFAVSTSGKTSRNNGASLHVNLSYPPGAIGEDANISKIKVDLPKQLPSRLTTLQKACTSAQFEANPAGCPAASRVGQAKANTPLIPVSLEGPAYFVSYGGAKFPELVMVLQGYGVTLDVHGETYIDKAGITSSTFKTIPDAPVGSFELTLPEGPDSALAANGNLCKSKLKMPTAFVGQNGAEIHESTPIEVSGCKPSVYIVRHSVKGANVAVSASVPSAGKLVAEGPGLSRAVKRTGKAGTLTFALKLSARERALLRGHPGRKLAVAVKLLFTPAHGQKLTAGVTVNVG
jgi:hypothetical protein